MAIGSVDIQGLTLEMGQKAKLRHRQMPPLTSVNATSEVGKNPHPISKSTHESTQDKKEAAFSKPLYQAIAECHFNVNGNIKISKGKHEEIMRIYHLLQPKHVQAHQVHAVKEWWNGKGYKFFPKKLEALEQVYLDYLARGSQVRESEDRDAQAAAERAERRKDMVIS